MFILHHVLSGVGVRILYAPPPPPNVSCVCCNSVGGVSGQHYNFAPIMAFETPFLVCIADYGRVWHSAVWHVLVQVGEVIYSTVQYSAAQNSVVQCSIKEYTIAHQKYSIG